MKTPVIKPATFLCVAQCLNQLHTRLSTIVMCGSLFLYESNFTVEQKLRMDILYSIIMWFWTKSLFKHKRQQMPTVALNC